MEEIIESLKRLSIDELTDLLIKSTNELVDLLHSSNDVEFQAKKKQVQLIRQAIVTKRAEFRPGPSL